MHIIYAGCVGSTPRVWYVCNLQQPYARVVLKIFYLWRVLQEHAFESSQKYKEGKYIIEMAHMIKENGWESPPKKWASRVYTRTLCTRRLSVVSYTPYRFSVSPVVKSLAFPSSSRPCPLLLSVSFVRLRDVWDSLRRRVYIVPLSLEKFHENRLDWLPRNDNNKYD